MSDQLSVFCAVIAAYSAFQVRYAHPLGTARTAYEVADRPSWIVGAVLAIGIAVWRPWFTESYFRAVVSAVLLLPFLSSIGLNLVGGLVQKSTSSEHPRRSSLFGNLVMLTLGFLALRACG